MTEAIVNHRQVVEKSIPTAVGQNKGARAELFTLMIDTFGEEECITQIQNLLQYVETPDPELWGKIQAGCLRQNSATQ